jgi:hypothetical protein
MVKEVEIQDPSLKDRIKLQGKKIKGHVEKHKWVYVGGVVVVLSRGYFRPTYAPSVNIIDIVAKIRPIGILSNQKINLNIIKMYTAGPGRPGHFVHLFGRPDIGYPSQTAAAKIFGVSDQMVSRHVNGHIPHINGYRLVRPVV